MTRSPDEEGGIYRYWCDRGTWEAVEAAALCARCDPRKINWNYVDYCTTPDLANSIREVLSRLQRAIQAGILPLLFTPLQFLKWADQHHVHVSDEFRSAILQRARKRSKSAETRRSNTELDVTAALLVNHYGFDPNKPMLGLATTFGKLLTSIGRPHDPKTLKRVIDDVREILRDKLQ